MYSGLVFRGQVLLTQSFETSVCGFYFVFSEIKPRISHLWRQNDQKNKPYRIKINKTLVIWALFATMSNKTGGQKYGSTRKKSFI